MAKKIKINLVELCAETVEAYIDNLIAQKVYKRSDIYRLSASENSAFTEYGQDLFSEIYDNIWEMAETYGFKNEI